MERPLNSYRRHARDWGIISAILSLVFFLIGLVNTWSIGIAESKGDIVTSAAFGILSYVLMAIAMLVCAVAIIAYLLAGMLIAYKREP